MQNDAIRNNTKSTVSSVQYPYVFVLLVGYELNHNQ